MSFCVIPGVTILAIFVRASCFVFAPTFHSSGGFPCLAIFAFAVWFRLVAWMVKTVQGAPVYTAFEVWSSVATMLCTARTAVVGIGRVRRKLRRRAKGALAHTVCWYSTAPFMVEWRYQIQRQTRFDSLLRNICHSGKIIQHNTFVQTSGDTQRLLGPVVALSYKRMFSDDNYKLLYNAPVWPSRLQLL